MSCTRHPASAFLVLALLLGGCSRPPSHRDEPPHRGPKVNIPDFIANTAAYKGKSITLGLKVDEAIDQSQGQSLRNYVGRNVKFTAVGPKGEPLNLVITIPDGLSVPDAARSDDVLVTFVCTRGSLQQGNVSKSIERPQRSTGGRSLTHLPCQVSPFPSR